MKSHTTILTITMFSSNIQDIKSSPQKSDEWFKFFKNCDGTISIVDIEKKLSCNFTWDTTFGSFVPTSGDFIFLGFDIAIKNYNWLDFLEVMRDRFVKVVTQEKVVDSKILNMFDFYEYKSFINYSKTITLLENLGVVKTKLSRSYISTDKRTFCITSEDDTDIELWFEVDILGTCFGDIVTQKILDLYNKNFPDNV